MEHLHPQTVHNQWVTSRWLCALLLYSVCWRLVYVRSCCREPFVKTHLYWTYCMCQIRWWFWVMYGSNTWVFVWTPLIMINGVTEGHIINENTYQTHTPHCMTPTHNILLKSMLIPASVLNLNKQRISWSHRGTGLWVTNQTQNPGLGVRLKTDLDK